ncbi:alpha-L-rhamnosidase [Colletotrichum tofieldiae]|uniref:Alpha-L-rhamnosidase n=1 Tax=Colletotrichum tofieldiae TaxID=708197 RepID=A0A161VSA6_9PEZI|nr:alpha-L-rhamnosidase [Colletotrichum tofieldiae]GKT66286.1 alpha-L-rhamnosidase [Colletotrichum tofieldiae]GKT70547.1 alpha-L-rhamnosidase [Colletotrichum tofieldiae]GKT94584.1 alpha-L-rhamnosidase [Colletotrichum tofieldiae]
MADAPEDMVESVLPTRWNRGFEKTANDLCPKLHRWARTPQRVIHFDKDENEYFGVRAVPAKYSIDQLPSKTWGKGDDFILDFGIHMVGYVSMKLESRGSHMDAPCRLRLTFGESPLDVTLGMDNVKTWISTSWLPDEIINIDMCPELVSLSRRYSFRFLRVEVIDTSPKYKVAISDVKCECVSAISQDHSLDALQFHNTLLQKIDHVSISTLRDCMQTVFEDGPRRDRRLWSGDLRLQALANYSTFRDFSLVKRCIFQFAAVVREDDSVPACIFEQPQLTPSTDYIVDYDALFAAITYDYVAASGDKAAGHHLWPTVLGCVKRAISHLDPTTHAFDENKGEGWKFLDWQPGLEHSAGLHGVLLFSLKAANALAKLLDKETPFEDLVTRMTEGAKAFLSSDNLFVSGPKSQVSFASASWLVLAEAFPKDVARTALLNTLAHPEAVKPLTPYLWHHVCDALATVGCFEECVNIMTSYWGGMVRAGGDTFWECFNPDDPRASPYGDVRNNSFCHAWSCTPTYLLREKLKDFVGVERTVTVTMGGLDEDWIKYQVTTS